MWVATEFRYFDCINVKKRYKPLLNFHSEVIIVGGEMTKTNSKTKQEHKFVVVIHWLLSNFDTLQITYFTRWSNLLHYWICTKSRWVNTQYSKCYNFCALANFFKSFYVFVLNFIQFFHWFFRQFNEFCIEHHVDLYKIIRFHKN